MMPRRDRLVLGGLAFLAAALVVSGLFSVGGPGAGRAERRDQARLADLKALTAYVGCLAAENNGALPEALGAPVASCAADPPLADRFDGTPYLYEALSATSYRLCARIERADRISPGDVWNPAGSFEPSTGCLTVSVQN